MKPHRINLRSGGNRLKFYRIMMGIDQPEAAKKLKISRSHLVNLERGNRPIGTWTILTRICNFYNITPMTLVAWYYPKS